MRIAIILALSALTAQPLLAETLSWADDAASFGRAFDALGARIENERAERASAFRNAPLSMPNTEPRDPFIACPGIDDRFFVRRPLGDALDSVGSCLARVYGGAVEVRAGRVMSGGCPGDQGLVHCMSLREFPAIVIDVRTSGAAAGSMAADLNYGIIKRGGKLEDWDATVEISSSREF